MARKHHKPEEKVPPRHPKGGRLWLNDGSCIRLRPERPNQVWAYDCVEDRTRDGRKFRMLCVVDEFSREALAIGEGLDQRRRRQDSIHRARQPMGERICGKLQR